MRILVVEDQQKIGEFIRKGLEEHGFRVEVCQTGEDGFERACVEPYDAMVLDIMLPGRDGLSILRELRARHVATPVILLTARDGLEERIEGLNLGADDYLAKPFFVEELSARLNALLRRTSGAPPSQLKVADLTLDLITREVRRGGSKIELTAREFDLLAYLMRSPGRVYTRTQINEHVWDTHFDTETNVVDVAIARIRKKIDEGAQVKLIETIRGVGYRVRGPSEPS